MSAAIGAMAIAISVMFGLFRSQLKRTEMQYDECDKDRKELWKHVAQLENLSCSVEDCDERCPVKTKLKDKKK